MSASKVIFAMGALVLASTVAAAQSTDAMGTAATGPRVIGSNPSTANYSALLYDNGGFVTHPGAGFGGKDASIIEPGFNTFGYGHAQSAVIRVADDFNVPATKVWDLSTMTWFTYQTGAPTTGTITAAAIQVWSGVPDAGGTVVASNGAASFTQAFSNCYRVQDAAANILNNQRAVMQLTVDMSWVPNLGPGHYYVDVSLAGTLASGPWANPTVPHLAADNGLQKIGTGLFAPMQDATALVSQDLPYKLNGTELIGASSYCTAKTNSLGCLPVLSAGGNAFVAGNPSGFVLSTTNVINNKPGLYIYTNAGPAATPFQGGFLCISGPLKRAVPLNSGGNAPPNDCSGNYVMDMNMFANGSLGGTPAAYLNAIGTTINTQCWGRDPGLVSTLSQGLQYFVN